VADGKQECKMGSGMSQCLRVCQSFRQESVEQERARYSR